MRKIRALILYYKAEDNKTLSYQTEWPEAFMWFLIQEYYNYMKYGITEPPEVVQNTKAYEQESDTFAQKSSANF